MDSGIDDGESSSSVSKIVYKSQEDTLFLCLSIINFHCYEWLCSALLVLVDCSSTVCTD